MNLPVEIEEISWICSLTMRGHFWKFMRCFSHIGLLRTQVLEFQARWLLKVDKEIMAKMPCERLNQEVDLAATRSMLELSRRQMTNFWTCFHRSQQTSTTSKSTLNSWGPTPTIIYQISWTWANPTAWVTPAAERLRTRSMLGWRKPKIRLTRVQLTTSCREFKHHTSAFTGTTVPTLWSSHSLNNLHIEKC